MEIGPIVINVDSLCVGLPYPLELPPECVGALMVEWEVANILPTGVMLDEVEIRSRHSATPFITVPAPGDYYLFVTCCM